MIQLSPSFVILNCLRPWLIRPCQSTATHGSRVLTRELKILKDQEAARNYTMVTYILRDIGNQIFSWRSAEVSNPSKNRIAQRFLNEQNRLFWSGSFIGAFQAEDIARARSHMLEHTLLLLLLLLLSFLHARLGRLKHEGEARTHARKCPTFGRSSKIHLREEPNALINQMFLM